MLLLDKFYGSVNIIDKSKMQSSYNLPSNQVKFDQNDVLICRQY